MTRAKGKEKIYSVALACMCFCGTPVYTCGCASVAYACTSCYGLIRPNNLLLSFMLVDFLYQNPAVDPLKDEVSRN